MTNDPVSYPPAHRQQIYLPEIQIVTLATLLAQEPFGDVARAAEVLNVDYIKKDWRVQLIELPPNTSFEPHYHVSEHIILPIKGSGYVAIWRADQNHDRIRAQRRSKQVYHAEVGQLVFIPQNTIHAFSSLEDGLREIIINNPGLELHHHQRINWI